MADDAPRELRRRLPNHSIARTLTRASTHPELLLLRTALHKGKTLGWQRAGCGTVLQRKAYWSQPDVCFPVTVVMFEQ